MQAIQTKYIGPTNYRPSRIVAKCDAGKLTVSWDYSLGVDGNHFAACVALMDKLEWNGHVASGTLSDGTFVHVLTSGSPGKFVATPDCRS